LGLVTRCGVKYAQFVHTGLSRGHTKSAVGVEWIFKEGRGLV
jgi:hypothetical protein